MKSKILGLLAVGLLAGPMAAQAVPVQWSLNYANNGLGSAFTLSGSFIYDADTNVFSSINVSINDTAGYMLDSTFTFAVPSTAARFVFWDSLAADRTGAQSLYFQLVSGLTNAGGVISLLSGVGDVFASRCLNPSCTATNGYGVAGFPDPADGSLVGAPINVPEPGTLALLGLGLAGFGLSRIRKAA